MKRAMIAVCLLVLSPSGVRACYEDHSPGAGWFDERSGRGPNHGGALRSVYRDSLIEGSLATAGSGLMILLGILVQTRRSRAERASGFQMPAGTRTPLVVEIERPPCDPILASVGFDSQVECGSFLETVGLDAEPVTSGLITVDFMTTCG
jgi:hypothetical protein